MAKLVLLWMMLTALASAPVALEQEQGAKTAPAAGSGERADGADSSADPESEEPPEADFRPSESVPPGASVSFPTDI